MKPLKIIHCANFSESKNGSVYYSIDRKLTNGLIRNGHFIYDFSYREVAKNATLFKSKKTGAKKMNLALLETIHNIKPDILLLGHSEIVHDSTLEKIKKLYPQIKIAMWWVDPLINIKHIPNRLPYLDAFFATTGVSQLSQVFGDKHQCQFYHMPNCCDASIDTHRGYELSKHTYDLIFLGRYDAERKEFINYLKTQFKDLKLGIFGNSKENLVLGQDYFDTLIDTKIGINYSRFNDIELYSSDRIIQLLANGVFTLSPRIPKMELLFSENEIVYFDTLDEFKQKVYYYLRHEEERMKIAKAGYTRAHTSYNSTRVTNFMIETLYGKYTQNYEWID